MFESITKLLPKTFNKKGLGSFFDSYLVINNCKELLEEKLGVKDINNYKIKSFKNQIITIEVNSSVLASELQMYSTELIENLNNKSKKENSNIVIKKIRFRVR